MTKGTFIVKCDVMVCADFISQFFSCLSSSYANSWKSLFQFFSVRPHIYFDLPQVNYNVTACFFSTFFTKKETRPKNEKNRELEYLAKRSCESCC